MIIRIGDAVSLSRPENFKYTPDDRQTVIETDGGNIVQDYGHISSGDRINFSAVFRRDEFMKIWEYFNSRSKIDFVDHSGITWQGMRVRVVSYGYEDRFEQFIDCEIELWRI